MALAAYTPTLYINDQTPALNDTNLNKSEVAIEAVTDEAILLRSEVDDLTSPEIIPFTPSVTAPTYTEANVYYDDPSGTLAIQGKYSDVTMNVGREQHIEVINNTASIILNGAACRSDGVSLGNIQAAPALADDFSTSKVLGVATHNIAVGATGILTTFGVVNDIDTSGMATGVPMYLSSTVAGEWSDTVPDIATQIGGVVVDNATIGKLFVSIRNHINPPAVVGVLGGQTTGVYSVTATPQAILDYTVDGNVVMGTDVLTGGITTNLAGFYRATFNASISFPSSTSTRVVDFEIYNSTDSAIVKTFHVNIPRDATEDSINFSPAISLLANKEYLIRISGDTITLTLDQVDFDITSVHIR